MLEGYEQWDCEPYRSLYSLNCEIQFSEHSIGDMRRDKKRHAPSFAERQCSWPWTWFVALPAVPGRRGTENETRVVHC